VGLFVSLVCPVSLLPLLFARMMDIAVNFAKIQDAVVARWRLARLLFIRLMAAATLILRKP
jgi:hypothetical protein